MSPVALGLDILLIALLGVALTLGLRLNKKLTALREGQARFVTAVGELDQSATRAETALKALRAASEDTHDALLTRIETARALILKLETAAHAAETARAVAQSAPTPAPAPAPAAPPVRGDSRLDPRFRELEQRLAARRAPAFRPLDDDLFESDEPSRLAGGQRR